MITSMSNSRCLRIAIAIAAGIPNSAMIATAVSRNSGQPGLAERDEQQGDELADDERGYHQGQPLDLLAQQPAASPVPHGQGHEGDGQERHERHEQPVERADRDRPQQRPEVGNAERVREGQRGPAGRRELHQPRPEDQADGAQPGQQEASRGQRAPAPRRQLPGREEEDHEREEERNAGETDLGERAHLLRRRERPGKRGDPEHRVRGSQAEKGQPSAFAEHQPADQVASAADDERAERGVGHDCHRSAQVRDQVAGLQVAPRDNSQRRPGECGEDQRSPHSGAGLRRPPPGRDGARVRRHSDGLIVSARCHDPAIRDRHRPADAYRKPATAPVSMKRMRYIARSSLAVIRLPLTWALMSFPTSVTLVR